MKTSKRTRVTAFRRHERRASAAVEAALCIPVIVLLMFATLEICSGFFLQQSLTIAAYEGARTGVKRKETREAVEDMVERILIARGVDLSNGVSIDVRPSDLTTLDALDPVQVSVSVPTAGNSALVFDFLTNRTVRATVRMAREFDH